MARCRFNNTSSPHRHVHTGVPQGSCISPSLFNFLVSSYPSDPHITSSSYADDFTDSYTSHDIQTAARALLAHAANVSHWADERGLLISAPKSSITVFTSHTHQSHSHPDVSLRDSPLPLVRNPRILGITLSRPPLHILSTHQLHHHSRFRQSQHSQSPCWHLMGPASGNHTHNIPIPHTFTLHICRPNMVPQHLPFQHSETPVYPKLCPQDSSRLGENDRHRPSTRRNPIPLCKRPPIPVLLPISRLNPYPYTHVSSYYHSPLRTPTYSPHPPVQIPLLRFSIPLKWSASPNEYKDTLKALHTTAILDTISSRNPNKVLQTPPPPIFEEELSLPHPYRSTRSQLRSGYCSALNYFRSRVGLSPDDRCPSCTLAPHTTSHLFSCPSHPTSLEVRDLWERPVPVVEYLSSLPFLSFLPALFHPPPEPLPAPGSQ